MGAGGGCSPRDFKPRRAEVLPTPQILSGFFYISRNIVNFMLCFCKLVISITLIYLCFSLSCPINKNGARSNSHDPLHRQETDDYSELAAESLGECEQHAEHGPKLQKSADLLSFHG